MLETDAIEFPNLFAGAQQLGRPIVGLVGRGDTQAWERWGAVWQQCTHTSNKSFGWKQNNTIGSTPKSIPGQQLGKFYTQHRLGYQFQRFTAGRAFSSTERLLAAILNCWHTSLNPHFGDLWRWECSFVLGEPVILTQLCILSRSRCR